VHAGLNRPQWLLAIPATSAGGLNVVVRSMSTDDPLLVVPSVGGAEPFTAEAFARTAGRATGELLVSLVPAQIRRLLEHPAGIDALAGCARVLIGGEALPGGLAESMQALGIRATSTYGCTETAGGCVFDGEPGPQVAVQIGQDRRITISGPTVAIGYRGSDKAFHGTFTTFDIGELDRGRVRVLGRIDDIVQIKGVNVSLGAVGEILRGLDGVEEVYVVPGPPLTAFAVLSDDARFDDAQARDTVSAELGQAARPGIVQLPALPRLPNGKVDRAALNDLVAGRR
jgi:O-succinylbenzoic acid--CoA ligase